MFRLAVAAGCAGYVAGTRVTVDVEAHEVETEDLETYCPSVSGFYATPGKCGPDGAHITNFANGAYANYGQDANGGIRGVGDAAKVCREHYDCVGFYTREGVGYSHYRSSITYVSPNPGHCCYQKHGHSLSELSGETNDAGVAEESSSFVEEESESFAKVSWERAAGGCFQIHGESQCLRSYDGRRDYGNSACAWCCGHDCGNGFRCEPKDWLVAQGHLPGARQHRDGDGSNSCSGRYPSPSPPPPPQGPSSNGGCYTINDRNTCLQSWDGRRGTPFDGQQCAWCGGSRCTDAEHYTCQPYDWLMAQPDHHSYHQRR